MKEIPFSFFRFFTLIVERAQDSEIIDTFGWNFLFNFKLLALKSYDFFLEFARNGAIECVALERCFINAREAAELPAYQGVELGLATYFTLDAKRVSRGFPMPERILCDSGSNPR